METNERTKLSISAAEWQRKNTEGLSPIDHLFKKFSMHYMEKWNYQFQSIEKIEEWKTAWSEEFENEGISFAEVKNGLEYCKRHYEDRPPTFGQFLKACRPPIDHEAAFHEAIQQMHLREKGQDQWSNPAIYWAAVAMGSDLMSMTYKQVEKRWEAALNKAVQDVKSGISDSVIPKRVKPSGYLSAPKRDDNHSEEAKRALAKIGEIFKQEPKWKKDKNMKQVAQHVEIKGAA